VKRGDDVQERRHEPQVVEERDQRTAREDDSERPVRKEPAIGLPREKHDQRGVQRERDHAGNEVGMNAARWQTA
jgi:hypothetical protein